MILDGRIITIPQIGPHLASLNFTSAFQPKFIVLHNSSVPDMATYQKWIAAGRPTMHQWLQNLAAYYRSLGWNSMPHAFVLPDGTIGLGAPFNVRGTHTPSWNSISIGVETLGEFERDAWAGTLTEKATIALFGELCKRFHWHPDQYVRGVRGIHFHKEDPNTTHRTCPGKHVEKAKFVQQVLAYMGDSVAATETDRNGHLDAPLAAQEGVSPAGPTVAAAPMNNAPAVAPVVAKPPSVVVPTRPAIVQPPQQAGKFIPYHIGADPEFEKCLLDVEVQEGVPWASGPGPANAFSDDAHDPGGKTMEGITEREYDFDRRTWGLPMRPVRNMTKDEERTIYYFKYWLPDCPKLYPGLNLEFFNMSVNGGPGQASRLLQTALGVTVDSVIGPVTLAAVKAQWGSQKVIDAYRADADAFYRSRPGFQWFGKGWIRRNGEITAQATAMNKAL